MLKPLKFKHSEESKIYFWGCLHVFHKQNFIWQKRGYNSIEEHVEAIKNKINITCRPQDKLFIIGDGFLNSEPKQIEDFLFSLNPSILYIYGNHESSIVKLYRKYRDYQYGKLINFNEDTEIYPLSYNNITFYGNYLECWINKQPIIIQHFPLKVWNYMKFSYMLHSHNHGGLASSLPDANDGKILDTGIDVFPDAPICFSKIKEIMDKKEVRSFDSHH